MLCAAVGRAQEVFRAIPDIQCPQRDRFRIVIIRQVVQIVPRLLRDITLIGLVAALTEIAAIFPGTGIQKLPHIAIEQEKQIILRNIVAVHAVFPDHFAPAAHRQLDEPAVIRIVDRIIAYTEIRNSIFHQKHRGAAVQIHTVQGIRAVRSVLRIPFSDQQLRPVRSEDRYDPAVRRLIDQLRLCTAPIQRQPVQCIMFLIPPLKDQLIADLDRI